MAKIKFKFYKTSNALILGLLTLLGFSSSCFQGSEYGCPSAKFIVNGEVSSKTNDSKIKNIRVKLGRDSVLTDSKGKYHVVYEVGFPENQTFKIKFKDIDGETNGEFNDLDTVVEFINPEFVNGDGNWDHGETTKEFNVKLSDK